MMRSSANTTGILTAFPGEMRCVEMFLRTNVFLDNGRRSHEPDDSRPNKRSVPPLSVDCFEYYAIESRGPNRRHRLKPTMCGLGYRNVERSSFGTDFVLIEPHGTRWTGGLDIGKFETANRSATAAILSMLS